MEINEHTNYSVDTHNYHTLFTIISKMASTLPATCIQPTEFKFSMEISLNVQMKR